MQKTKSLLQSGGGYLEHSLLIAMPSLNETSFGQSVIVVCSHSDEGAMGFVLNKMSDIPFSTFMNKLKEDSDPNAPIPTVTEDLIPVHIGGTVDVGRGFVLHTSDFMNTSSMPISDNLAVTATVEVLFAIASGKGPEKAILCLGYAGWSAGQLEDEIAENSWLTCPLDEEAIFDPDIDRIYTKSLASIGVELAMLSSFSGNA